MEFPIENMQSIKNGVHIVQVILIFVSWIIMIAVFRSKDSKVDGRPGWFFALCFLTLPAIIYQTMTPIFPRSRKFGNPYAFASIDIVFAILWLSAFAAVASWNSDNKCGHGCKLSKADVGLGFFIFLFFAATSAMSVYGVTYFRRNGSLPGSSRVPNNASMIDPDAEAFSTAPNDDEYAPVGMNDHEHDPKNDHDEDHPYDTNTSYGGGSSLGYNPSYGNEPDYGHAAPLGMNPTSYGEHSSGRAQFPVGNYD